jgi:hypothetical protein
VRATNAGGPSGWSNAVVTYTPPVVVPGAPTIAPNFVAPSGTVTVTWAAVPGATSYEYYIAGGPSTVTDTNSAQLAGLVYGTSTFMVRAVNSAGSSTYSMASLFVPDPPAPPVVAFTAIRSTAHRYVRFAGVVGGVSTPTPVRVAVFVYKASAHKYVKYAFNTTTLASGAFSVRVRLGRSGRAYAVVTSNGLQKRSKAFVVRP